jgi:hypothetical protein
MSLEHVDRLGRIGYAEPGMGGVRHEIAVIAIACRRASERVQ